MTLYYPFTLLIVNNLIQLQKDIHKIKGNLIVSNKQTQSTFGIILRSTRESRMLSQKDLAEKVGIAPSHLNKLESGVRMPSSRVLNKIAETLVAPNLYIAAGRLIPNEFEEKFPSPKTIPIEEIKLPDILKILQNYYWTNFKQASTKETEMVDYIRDIERFISSWEDSYNSLENTLDKLENAKQRLDLYYKLRAKAWQLQVLAWKKGILVGKSEAVVEVYDEIKKLANINMAQFLVDFTELSYADAEFIADIIELRQRKKSKEN